MLKRILYSTHKILGTILSILFLVWFLSGFVMMYHTFPKVSNKDKYSHMDALSREIKPIDSILKKLPENTKVFSISLKSFEGKPFYEVRDMDGVLRISAESEYFGDTVPTIQFNQIQEYAKRWCDAPIIKVDTLYKLEQWIPFGYLKKDFPIYKFYFGDKDKHQLYVSSVSGEALQFTNKDNRFWSWLGAIPHWIYFTSLRQNSQLWMNLIICLSGIGCVVCIAGIVIGIRSYIIYYRKKKKWKTPYKKLSYKWHHILGFIFGIFVFTFTFSGMMSLADVPQWLVKTKNLSIQEDMYFPKPVNLDNYHLNIDKMSETYAEKLRSVEWASFGDIPFYKVVVDDCLLTIDASTDSIKTLQLTEEDVRKRILETHTKPIQISTLTEYDNYYVGVSNHLPLPVYKVTISDADNSTYYVNPENGNIRYFNTNSKVHRWMYQALHSFKIGFFSKHPILRSTLMWVTMIGGTLVSFTGVWLGVKYVNRKIRNIRKKNKKI